MPLRIVLLILILLWAMSCAQSTAPAVTVPEAPPSPLGRLFMGAAIPDRWIFCLEPTAWDRPDQLACIAVGDLRRYLRGRLSVRADGLR